jgi:hypothetical protein
MASEPRTIARAAHDIGMAGLLGGNLYGRLALHPAVTEISDERERGRLVNAAWRRYGAINTLSLAAVAAGWAGERAQAGSRAKDVLVGVVAATGLATGAEGMRFARQAPGGAVPLRDGERTSEEASQAARRLKKRLNALGAVSLAAEVGLVAVNAALNQRSFRRPPARRLLPRAGRV